MVINRGMTNTEASFDVSVSSAERPVVTVTGELDMYSAPRLREKLIGLVTAGKADIVVDLSGVSFIDSSGLGVLVGALKRCRTSGGELALKGVNAQTSKVLSITGLDKVFPTAD